MPDNESKSSDAIDQSVSAETYQTNRISRRDALKRFGAIVSGVSLAGFGMFENYPAHAANLEAMDDPQPSTEQSSSEESSLVWIPTSSMSICSDCSIQKMPDGSYGYSWWTSSSSSSWSYWWVTF